MTKYDASMDRDANYQVITSNEAFKTTKSVTFTGAAGLGAIGDVNLFTVTGAVMLWVVGYCTSDLAGASATVTLGHALSKNSLIATTTATTIVASRVWADTTPASLDSTPSTRVAVNTTILVEVAIANVTGGAINFYCFWRPLSDDGNVVAA